MLHKDEMMQLLDGFEEDGRLRGLSEDSLLRYRSPIKKVMEILEERGLTIKETDKEVLKEFLRRQKERNLSKKTLKHYFAGLSTFYEYLMYEGVVDSNPIKPFRRRYLQSYKSDKRSEERKLLSVEDMSRFISVIVDPRAKAIAMLFAKTGIRRGELIAIDIEDIDWENQSIMLKPKAKRSNRIVFFDDECSSSLKRWMIIRDTMGISDDCHALFVNYVSKKRIDRNRVYDDIVNPAIKAGYYDPESDKLSDHFTPHAFRHWFTTWLLRNGMPREYVKELRGDARHDAIDIYNHIDMDDLRKEYMARIPKLGIF